MIRFIHTADWQIGKPFAGIEDSHNRALVQQERVAVIDRIRDAAKSRDAAFVLVAGDLFDSPTPTRAMVSSACAAIGRIGRPVVVIPGNHDHGGAGGLWEHDFFLGEQRSLAPNLMVLTTPEPVECAGAMIFPCPLLRRAESNDTTAWLRDPAVFGAAGDRVRIVLAHGSSQGFGADSDEDETTSTATNQFDLDQLEPSVIDYTALGDWHGTKQVGPKSWYSGTPEIDRFPKGDENQPGHVLSVSVERGASPTVETIRTARLGWHRIERDLAEDSAVGALQSEVETLLGQRTQQDLVRMELTGSLGIAATSELEELLERLSARLLRLKLIDRTLLAPTDDEVVALTQRSQDPLTARVAQLLVERTTLSGEEAEIARIALRELHATCVTG